jgi:hypothetical protein
LGPLDAPLLRDQTLTVNLPVSIDEKIGQARNWGDIADKFTIVSIEPPVAGGYFSINKAGELHVTRLGVLHLRRREYRLTVEADNVVGSGRAVITIKVV